MDLRTYRARSLPEALRLVREELGPDASVLHTRDVTPALARWLGARQIEVTASAEVQVPSRIDVRGPAASSIPAAEEQDFRSTYRQDLFQTQRQSAGLEEICRGIYVENERWDSVQELAKNIRVTGPLRISGTKTKVVALVGPTGVGKTTSIAKLAAHYVLKENCRVGLITVDTYRVAAVEQLRTYADIMSLPLEVVSSPREMEAAVSRLTNCDLVFIDTAGRSPRDEVRMGELRLLLAQAGADEIILVLSAAAGIESCRAAADAFKRTGATSLLLTKLDEAESLAHLEPLLSNPHLPICYLSDGQNVPDDIAPANPLDLARRVAGGGA